MDITGGSPATPVTPTEATISALEIVERALRRINVISPEQSSSGPMGEDGLTMLNELVDLWKAKSIYAYCINHDSFAWTTSKSSYTIGPSLADFTAARPIRIIRANLILVNVTPNDYIPLEVIEEQDFSRLYQRVQSGSQPLAIYYKPTSPLGTIYPYPYPENTAAVLANKLELVTLNQLDQFTDLTTQVDLPPAYRMALISNLAEMFCEPYEKSVPANLKSQARMARNTIAMMNTKATKIATADSGVPFSSDW